MLSNNSKIHKGRERKRGKGRGERKGEGRERRGNAVQLFEDS